MKYKIKDKTEEQQFVHEGLYLGCFVLFILGMWVMLVGIHNVDQGRNFIWLALQFDFDLDAVIDCSFAGCVSMDELHTLGMTQMLVGAALIIVSWTGMFMGRMFMKRRH